MKSLFEDNSHIEPRYRFRMEDMTKVRIARFDDKSYSHFRKASTSYANRVFVKRYIMGICKSECVSCGSKIDLQIDHIKSVRVCFDKREFMLCNTVENLQVLCFKCNNKKSDKNIDVLKNNY